jgi:hypothetical protein
MEMENLKRKLEEREGGGDDKVCVAVRDDSIAHSY